MLKDTDQQTKYILKSHRPTLVLCSLTNQPSPEHRVLLPLTLFSLLMSMGQLTAVITFCASLLHDQCSQRSKMKSLALLSLALLATALIVHAKTEKDVTSLQIGVKVGSLRCHMHNACHWGQPPCSAAREADPLFRKLQLCCLSGSCALVLTVGPCSYVLTPAATLWCHFCCSSSPQSAHARPSLGTQCMCTTR